MAIFDRYSVVLVQFREPGRAPVPEGIEVSAESARTNEERRKRNESQGIMPVLLKRNGAACAKLRKRLAHAGYGLERAYAEVRHPAGEHGGTKLFTLVTFVFQKGHPQAPEALEKIFARFARNRYESVQASEGKGHAGAPVLCISAKTTADPAIELEKIDDGDASAYGIVVTKAVHKDKRRAQAAVHERKSAA